MLSGHTDKVNAVRFFPRRQDESQVILSGSVDHTIRIWGNDSQHRDNFRYTTELLSHSGSINCLAVTPGTNLIVSGAADATVRIWRLDINEERYEGQLLQTIQVTPRFFPLSLALSVLTPRGALILAVGGTRAFVQTFVTESGLDDANFVLKATLTGHEGWIRSLAFACEKNGPNSDLLLASASQDKYIRLWRVSREQDLPAANISSRGSALGTFGKALSNKEHRFEANESAYSLTFEALLLGHEDWAFSIAWSSRNGALQLLSASADNSLAIWESDAASGVWIPTTRLGEISSHKGSTTATGSTGGFWIGLWSPDGAAVASLGRTGSWRLWKFESNEERWTQGLGISGHVKSVTSIAWAKDGSYLLSTGSDQTTRLHAEWTKRKENRSSWHEFARPQIHGYDLNCIDSLGISQFVSGADEKLLRVFDEPRAIADMLERMCDISISNGQDMPDAANVPALGLSNKAMNVMEEDKVPEAGGLEDREALGPGSVSLQSTIDIDHPPFEDHLARHTLWPEREKLYGHGYEISAVAASHDGKLIATACKATSLEHAVIRLYETIDWREIKPSLTAHSLTVTRLVFSDDDEDLLSVGRDRQWVVHTVDHDAQTPKPRSYNYILKDSNPKGHSRMILDATWAHSSIARVFATAGRDKAVKFWSLQGVVYKLTNTIVTRLPVTAIDISTRTSRGLLRIAVGLEDGSINIYLLHEVRLDVQGHYDLGRE